MRITLITSRLYEVHKCRNGQHFHIRRASLARQYAYAIGAC